ncbi:hypothetical protein EBZ39_00620 [bacterium]|nr:hypothetical protein [bacterium]
MAKGEGTPADDTPLTSEEIKGMVRGMLRYPTILQDAIRLGVEPTHLNYQGEQVLYFLFSAMCNLFGLHGALTEEMLTTELKSWYAGGHMHLPPDDYYFLFGDEHTPGVISSTFNTPKLTGKEETADKKYVENILRRFINARIIKHQLHNTFRSLETGAPPKLHEILSHFTNKAQAVDFIGRDVTNAAFAPEFGSKIVLPPKPIATGMAWVDEYIGGFRTGDIIGVLGPYSGGKTTLLATAAVRMAQNFHSRGEQKLSVYVCYEDGADKMNPLFWSAGAHIHRERFTSERFWDDFSTREKLNPYDYRLPENKNGKIVLGERERWEGFRGWFNNHFVFLDFSENASSGGRGSGGVAEIVAALTRLQERLKMEIGFVAIDYAMLLINRELAKDARTKNMEQVWRPMQQLPDAIRTQIAVPFNSTVMLAHQLAGGDIKKIPPFRYVSHLDAQGSKAFAENLHACMCINQKDEVVNVSTIHWSKIRAALPITKYGLIKLDPDVVDVHLVNKEYEACETARRIVKKGEVGFVAPEDAGDLKKPKRKVDSYGFDLLGE